MAAQGSQLQLSREGASDKLSTLWPLLGRETDEGRRIDQDVLRKKKVRIPKKIFLLGERLSEEEKLGYTNFLFTKSPGKHWTKISKENNI